MQVQGFSAGTVMTPPLAFALTSVDASPVALDRYVAAPFTSVVTAAAVTVPSKKKKTKAIEAFAAARETSMADVRKDREARARPSFWERAVGWLFKTMVVPVVMFGAQLAGAGCTFDKGGIAPPDGNVDDAALVDGGRDGQVDAAIDAGRDAVAADAVVDAQTDAATQDAASDAAGTEDAAPPDASTQDAQTPVDDRPALTWPYLSTLPNNRLFVRWTPPAQLPAGKNIDHYEVTLHEGAITATKTTDATFVAFEMTTPTTLYEVRVRSHYDDATTSLQSASRFVATDHSLVGRYAMDESAGTLAGDSSGTGNAGMLVNFDPTTAWVTGAINTGLLFDGADSYVDTGAAFDFDQNDLFTIEAWVERSTTGSNQTLFSKQDLTAPTTGQGYWLGFLASGAVWFDLTHDAAMGDQIAVRTTSLYTTAGAPLNITLTYDGAMVAAGAKIYVDGAESATTSVADLLLGSTLNAAPSRIGAAVALGGPMQNAAFVLNGIVDDVAVYSRALDADEVANSTCAREALNRETTWSIAPLPPACD